MNDPEGHRAMAWLPPLKTHFRLGKNSPPKKDRASDFVGGEDGISFGRFISIRFPAPSQACLFSGRLSSEESERDSTFWRNASWTRIWRTLRTDISQWSVDI